MALLLLRGIHSTAVVRRNPRRMKGMLVWRGFLGSDKERTPSLTHGIEVTGFPLLSAQATIQTTIHKSHDHTI